MYSVLIVDDEEPVLDSYAFLLESAGTDFVLAGKARTGFEAIKAIHELKPDVVFMDINMPGMDGIQVIAEVHDSVPGTVFILSTAYERFDLVQRAIPLGIFSYLVKPVSKKTFLSTLDSLRSALEKRRPAPAAGSSEFAERQFLKETIWKELSREEWEKFKDLFSFHSDKGIVCLVEVSEAAERWCREIAAKLSFRHRCLFAMHLNRGLYLIPEDVDRSFLLSRLAETVAATVPEALFRSYAAGQVHRGPELYLSCNEALEELHKKKSYADVRLRERMRIVQIRRKIGIAPQEEVRDIFIALWGELFASYDFSVAKAKMTVLFSLLVDDCTGCFSSHTDEEPLLSPAEEIMPIKDLSDWGEWSLQAFNELHGALARKRSRNFPPPLAKALDFLNERFADQLQLPVVAEAAQVSGAYLSRLFSEHLHTTFIDYLTELRVEKAERLIREARMNVKEVAYAVGYQDPNYFSKIFRKATGMPPTVYAAERRPEKGGL
ncbi:MAG: helix-turn-helix domain-containing protein [Spirochaetota bacterium]